MKPVLLPMAGNRNNSDGSLNNRGQQRHLLVQYGKWH
jgi:hypothetical protein